MAFIGKSDLGTSPWHCQDKHMADVKMEFKEDKKLKRLVSATSGIDSLLDQPSVSLKFHRYR